MKSKKVSQLLKGTLELMVLSTLDRGPIHAWVIPRVIASQTGGYLEVSQDTFYPVLYRLTAAGLVESHLEPGNGPRVRVYSLTAAGRTELESRSDIWASFCESVWRILDASARGSEDTDPRASDAPCPPRASTGRDWDSTSR